MVRSNQVETVILIGKEELEELKKLKNVKEPLLTADEKASKINKATIKGTGFNMEMVCSEKGKNMIERQRDSRRQRHIEALKECEKFTEQFYDNFKEKNNDIREHIKVFMTGSDIEIEKIMKGLTDELLLANEIFYVNGIWEKVNQHREARRDEVQHLRASFDDLKAFQQKGTGGYQESMRQNLIDIAFYLEPDVDKLLAQQVADEKAKYAQEHVINDGFYSEVVEKEKIKFDILYQVWKESVVKFHLIKQEDAIKRFLALLNSNKFVNPESRVQLFSTIKAEQLRVFNLRLDLMQQLEKTSIAGLTKDLVGSIDENLRQINDEAQVILDRLVEALAKDMENSNEDMDIALYDLKDFILKNDAQLEEGMTFDLLIEIRAKPTVDRRKLEAKTLITGSVKYMEECDFKMNEICQNIVNFFKELATRLDSNKDKLKQTEINFQVALAGCGDHNDEVVQQLEDDLEVKVDRMKKAIHHVQLNEKLQECFEMLDQITRQYRTYNQEYIELVTAHPTTMDTFYRDFEKDCVSVFKMFDESKRAEIHSLFTKETENRQRKLEEEALKKLEEEKKQEEAKKAEEDKNKPPVKGGAKPPAQVKKGKEPEKPLVDVPKLEIPKVLEYESQMGNKYLIQRKLEEIASKLSEPVIEEEVKQELPLPEPEPLPNNGKQSQLGNQPPAAQKGVPQQKPGQPVPQQKQPPQATNQQSQQQLLLQQQQLLEQQLLEEKLKEEAAKPNYTNNFEPNDFMDKAEKRPPQDPDAVQTLHEDLIISQAQIHQILTITLNKALEYLYIEKMTNAKRVAREGKDLQDKNVDELDENLRKQWPRKGRLEVEVYQERKSQISAHNKKYERQVRVCLEKYNLLDEQWAYILETVEGEFVTFTSQQDKLKSQLPSGKNLAELQGVSRKEKDSNQTFEEKCREYQDKMHDIAVTQPDVLIQQNDGMLKSCQLFENGGNYASDEVDWYRQQMQEINEMVQKSKEQRDVKLKEVYAKMEKLMKEPNEVFEKNYKGSIVNLSAKEGLGKTFGQPRRLAQERLRAEMTKCEQAQKGVDSLLEKLEQLIEKQESGEVYSSSFDYAKEKQSLSMEIRVNLISTIRCIAFYGTHLAGFVKEPKVLPRMSYLETKAELELQPTEVGITDEKRKEEELEHLGAIGFKNVTQVYLKFNESVAVIEKQSKEVCPKLYTGENIKFLVGPEKIPEYLTAFLEGMRRQAEEFRISCVRLLRTSALRLLEICQPLPKVVFGYLNLKYTSIIENELEVENKRFRDTKAVDDDQKKKNLKLFRPNLENPANKQLTNELNQAETKRTEAYKEFIDDIQLKMLDTEQERSLEFHNAYLNNLRGFIKAYDCLVYKEDFILLPGDEIIEKKHQNIKVLSAQAQKQDLSKRLTRKWAGLGPNVFEIDYPSLFAHYKDFKSEVEQPPVQPPPVQQKGEPIQPIDPNKTEISHEIDIPNTVHHKSIVKSRNDNYEKFKRRFMDSVKRIMEKFDHERDEEQRFNQYWASNLKEITQKHI